MIPAVSKALPAPPKLLDVVSCVCIVYGRACINGVAVTGQACLTIVIVNVQWDAIILLLIEKRIFRNSVLTMIIRKMILMMMAMMMMTMMMILLE